MVFPVLKHRFLDTKLPPDEDARSDGTLEAWIARKSRAMAERIG